MFPSQLRHDSGIEARGQAKGTLVNRTTSSVADEVPLSEIHRVCIVAIEGMKIDYGNKEKDSPGKYPFAIGAPFAQPSLFSWPTSSPKGSSWGMEVANNRPLCYHACKWKGGRGHVKCDEDSQEGIMSEREEPL